MKKIITYILTMILILALLPFQQVHATEGKTTVKVAFPIQYGFHEMNEDGTLSGYNYELLKTIEQFANISLEFIVIDEGTIQGNLMSALNMVLTGEADLIGGMNYDENLTTMLDFCTVPAGRYFYTISVLDTTEYYSVNDLQSKSDLSIVLNEKAVNYNEHALQQLKLNNIDAEVIYVDSQEECIELLSDGKVDAIVSNEVAPNTAALRKLSRFSPTPFYFATVKGNSDVVENLDQSLRLLQEANADVLNDLKEKYFFSNHPEKIYFTKEDRNYLGSLEDLTVGFLNFDENNDIENSEKMLINAMSKDVFDNIAEQLNIKAKYLYLQSYDELLTKWDNGELDILAATSYSPVKILDEIKYHNTILTTPYLKSNAVMLKNNTITNANSEEIYAYMLDSYKFKENINVQNSLELLKGLNKLKNGEISAIYTNSYLAQYYLNSYDFPEISTIPLMTLGSNLCFTVNKEHKELVSYINHAIIHISDVEMNEIIVANSYNSSNIEFFKHYKDELTLAFIVLILLVLIFVLLYMKSTKNNARKLKKLLEVDQITGLMTMSKMMSEMIKLLANAKPSEYYTLTFDIDNFKIVNQTYGFEKGNEVLCAVANSMKKHASTDALMCRLQNDVFMVFGKTANITEFSTDTQLFSQERCDEIMQDTGISTILHFSTGVYIIEDVDITIEKIFDAVRKARIESKAKHGNVMTVYSEELKLQTEKEMEIYSTMEKAIENKEFFIVVQPKIELETGKLIGGEVLVRWQKADGTFVYPNVFIPLFEKNNFIVNLDTYVFEEACRFMKNATTPLPHLSVNVSPMTALSDNFVDTYISILNSYSLKANLFELELIESALDMEFDEISEVSNQLREYGFRLSIDDFGKGASSLTRIQKIDIDVIKLDKGFIDNNFNSEKGNAVIANAIDLANSLGVTTLAEGIETKEQLNLLKELGCDLGQGYLFDKPLSTDEFMNRVIEDSKKEYPQVIKSKEKIKNYLSDFENLPYPIVLVNNDEYYTIISANESLYQLIGYTKKELLEEHKNHFDAIIGDNVHEFVTAQTKKGTNSFVFDMRIRRKDGKYVWINNNTTYVEQDDIFYSTLVDTTEYMKIDTIDLSQIAHQAQKESMLYLNSHTSEYVLISDIETGKMVYMNKNAMQYWKFTKESDWTDKFYYEIGFGSADATDKSYKESITEEFSSREYYNSFHDMYMYVENKLIEVMGRKMRLNIVTDITAKKKMESENNLQSTLKQCIEHLYTATTATATITDADAFQNMLEQLRMYYHADRAYYFAVSDEQKIAINFYEVVGEGVRSQRQDLQAIPTRVIMSIHEKFTQGNALCLEIEDLKSDEASIELLELFEEGEISNAILALVQDFENNIIGLIGVDNPKENIKNPELINLLSKYIWMYIRSVSAKTLEKEALQTEELSTVATLEKTAVLLQGHENFDKNIIKVLDLLRKHYGANRVALFTVDKENSTYSMTHESYASGSLSRFDENQNTPIASLEKLIKPYKNGAQFVSGNIEDIPKGTNQRKTWEKFGIQNAIIAPLFDNNNDIKAFISVSNRTFINRNQTLSCIIAKDINDYVEKISLERRYKEEIVLDPLTNLFNKMATQNIISKKLNEGTTGVLFIIDVDYFKNLNDTLGHSVGDVALIEIAGMIKNTFRSSDTVGRIGGDEFMVFCPNPIADDLVITKAKSICKNCNKAYKKDDKFAEISTSIGMLRINETGRTFKEVYEKVDKALYRAKAQGKNQFCFIEKE